MFKVRGALPGGAASNSLQATGFVISKSQRPVATAAHLADWFCMGYSVFALLDGTAEADSPSVEGAVILVNEAKMLRRPGRYHESRERCDESLLLAPQYCGAFLGRSKAVLYDLGARWTDLEPDKRLSMAKLAFADAERACFLATDWNDAWLNFIQLKIDIATIESSSELLRRSLAAAQLLMDRGWPYPPLSQEELSFAANLRAQCQCPSLVPFTSDTVSDRDWMCYSCDVPDPSCPERHHFS